MTISTVSTQSPEINIQHNQDSQQISGKLGEKASQRQQLLLRQVIWHEPMILSLIPQRKI